MYLLSLHFDFATMSQVKMTKGHHDLKHAPKFSYSDLSSSNCLVHQNEYFFVSNFIFSTHLTSIISDANCHYMISVNKL